MGVNWNNVIRNQMHGMDAVSAFYKEEKRVRDKNAEEYRKRVAKQQKQRELMIEKLKGEKNNG